MESLLWAMDLCAVVYLCLWALKTDKRRTKEAEQAASLAHKQAHEQATKARREAGHA